MRKSLRFFVVFFGVSFLTVGCQTSQGGKTYTRSQAQTALSVYYGTVLKVAEVQIETETTGVGAIVGGVAGGIVGSTIGSGRGRRLATTGGVLAGSAAGAAGEKARATKPALEIEVELDDGRLMVVVQEKDDEFNVGDRIRLVQSPDGTMRIRQ